MNVDDVIRERIEAARRKAEREKRQRAELAEARAAGLRSRYAAKLRRLGETGQPMRPANNPTADLPPENEDPTMPAAIRTAVCPSCRRQRPTRLITTVTVSGAPHDVVRCLEDACSLMWLLRAERPRTAPAAA